MPNVNKALESSKKLCDFKLGLSSVIKKKHYFQQSTYDVPCCVHLQTIPCTVQQTFLTVRV